MREHGDPAERLGVTMARTSSTYSDACAFAAAFRGVKDIPDGPVEDW
jgi:hypothetical protein